MTDPNRITRGALRQKTLDDLRRVWLEWRASLSAQADEWPRGAGYIRESHTESLGGEQPLVQLDA